MNVFNRHPFLIAEISFNFYDFVKEDYSYFDVAEFLIRSAKESGVDGINFHVGDSEFIYCNFEEDIDFIVDKLSFDDYKKLSEYCNEIGIRFIITPEDFEVVDELDDWVDAYKISASNLTNIPLIEYIASKNKPVLLSTAAATFKEIQDAVNVIEDKSNFKIILMHSVLSYPTKLEDSNLLMIKDLKGHFKDYDVGYSDYTISDNNMFVLTTAFNYGAAVLEKYFTLDKSLKGHEYSMDSDDVYIFRLNSQITSKINGFKNKQPLICESYSRKNVRKSIIAKNGILKGNLIKKSDIEFKRPENGIPPSQVREVIGKKASENIPEGTVIQFDMLI